MAVKRAETDTSLKVAELALALAAQYFPDGDDEIARFTDAAFLLSGHLHCWDRWGSLTYEEKQRFGRLLALRPERFANPTVFGRTMLHVLSAESPRIDSFRLTEDRRGARPVLGGDLAGFATRLFAELEAGPPKGGALQVATPGPWWLRRSRDGRAGENVEVTIPHFPGAVAVTVPLPSVSKAPYRANLTVPISDLLSLAEQLDALRPDRTPYLLATLDKLFAGLRTADGPLKEDLVLVSGLLRILNAPTGTGKSVLMRVLAVHLAQRGIRVAVIVPTIESSLGTAREIADDLDLLDVKAGCTPLMSPNRLHERAIKVAENAGIEEDWDEGTRWRLDQVSYGCALSELIDPASRPKPGTEPCELHRPDGKSGTGRESRVCLWKPTCPKFTQTRAAVTAGVVVTNHHYFLRGKLHTALELDGRPRDRMAAAEFLLSVFDVVIIDEIDQFQSTAVDVCAREMTLSSRARWEEIPLKRLDDDRARIPIRDSLRITPALSRLRELSDQLVNFVADGALRLPGVLQGVHTTKWQLPNAYDRNLIDALFGVPEDTILTAETYRRLDSLFPDYEPDRNVRAIDSPAEPLAPAKEILQTLLSHPNEESLNEARLQLDDLLSTVVSEKKKRAGHVTQMILKAWFAALQHHVRELQGEASRLRAVDLPSAREFVDGLAAFALKGPFPYGPLGYALVGFRFAGLTDPEGSTELSLQTITGDPHAYTAQLGSIVGLTLCGHERIVLGLSATAFFPGAVREHIHSPLAWWMTDAAEDAITVRDGRVMRGSDYIQISGLPKQAKRGELVEMGERLYETHLVPLLEEMRRDDFDRARVALAVNSYEQCLDLARGITRAVGYRDGLCVAVPSEPKRREALLGQFQLRRGVHTLTADEFEDFPAHGNILIAPMARITRGLNIVIGIRSALSAIFLCVRPLALMSDPAEMFASVNAAGHKGIKPSACPADTLAAARNRSRERLYQVLRAAPHFRNQDDDLQQEVVAGVIVDLIQLAGRARRGGTDMRLFLVDHAIHDKSWRSDMASIIGRMYAAWPDQTRADMRSVYGSALTSLLKDVAGIDPKDVQ
ncbi:hypothetical protein ACQP2T_61425 [Nonomuraea sp. CA-143628]|uniref:hypothetical protein n=1 Tax=Nonomuraea sp. CA-143628 TaxID=3239997 RepID=UPI003D93090D